MFQAKNKPCPFSVGSVLGGPKIVHEGPIKLSAIKEEMLYGKNIRSERGQDTMCK